MIEDIGKGGQLFAILQQLGQIVGNALRCRLLTIIIVAAVVVIVGATAAVVVRLACGVAGCGGGTHFADDVRPNLVLLLIVLVELLLVVLLLLLMLVLLLVVGLGCGCCSSRKVGEINVDAGELRNRGSGLRRLWMCVGVRVC